MLSKRPANRRALGEPPGGGESAESDFLVPITVEELANLAGTPDLTDRIRRAIGQAQDRGHLRLALDFGKVDRVCTAGLNELIAINSHARCDGLRVVLVNVQDEIREVFTLHRV